MTPIDLSGITRIASEPAVETAPDSEKSTENSHQEAESSEHSDAADAADAGYSEEAFAASVAGEAGNGKELTPLMDLDEAVARIPEALREQMQARLRADFREVRRYRKK